MKSSKRKKLDAAGWKVGSASDFLGLSPGEEMLVTMKLALAANVKSLRLQRGMTQQELAKRIGSSQSRIAKMEVVDASVSIELFVRALAALGASHVQIGKIIGTRVAKRRPITPRKKRLAKV